MVHCPRDGAVLAEVASDPLIGQTLAGRYVIEAALGEGGMGRVYRARHIRMERRFAIKVLHAELSLHGTTVLRFHREAAAISRLSHPNVVGIVDFGELDDGLLYLVMEHVEGRSLRAILRREGALASDRILRLLGQLCDGLAHAHRHGLVHRDFKPDNVLVEDADDGERARIVDFGIAADLAEHRITTDGLVVGTPHYMAPEQTAGERLDQRSDLYALGVVLYEMTTGVLPFAGAPALVAQMHALMPAPPMAERAPGVVVDPLLEALAHRLMAKRPEQRMTSAQEVRRLVRLAASHRDQALVALGVAARPDSELATIPLRRPDLEPRAERALAVAVTAPTRRRRKTGRRPVPRWLIGAAAALGMVCAGIPLLTPAPGSPPATAALAVATGPAIAPALAPELAPPATPSPVAPVITTIAPPAAAPAPADPAPVADAPPRRRPSSLGRRYRILGERLQRLLGRRDDAATAALRSRYQAIPIADALRNPARAKRVSREINALRRAVDRALARSVSGRRRAGTAARPTTPRD